jgi:hypothetical protein
MRGLGLRHRWVNNMDALFIRRVADAIAASVLRNRFR